MTSRKRRQGSPVESVTLKITFEGNRKDLSKIKKAVPSAAMRKGGCDVTLQAQGPAGPAEKAREILERLKAV